MLIIAEQDENPSISSTCYKIKSKHVINIPWEYWKFVEYF